MVLLKPNQILIGIIVVLIGAYSLLRYYVAFNSGMLMILVTGLALLLLYRQKKAVWALFAGGYLTSVGLILILAWAGFGLRAQTFAGMFFFVPGIIFMVLYFDKNKRGLLIPSCLMIWIGACFILMSAISLGVRATSGVLVMCIGCGFYSAYVIGRSYLSRWLRNLGVVLFLTGGLMFSGLFTLVGRAVRIVPYVLIAVGLLIIIKNIANKPRN